MWLIKKSTPLGLEPVRLTRTSHGENEVSSASWVAFGSVQVEEPWFVVPLLRVNGKDHIHIR